MSAHLGPSHPADLFSQARRDSTLLLPKRKGDQPCSEKQTGLWRNRSDHWTRRAEPVAPVGRGRNDVGGACSSMDGPEHRDPVSAGTRRQVEGSVGQTAVSIRTSTDRTWSGKYWV